MPKRDEQYLKKFGKNISRLRKERKYSQYQLADYADMARSQLIRIENGEVNTSLLAIVALAKVLEVHPKDLLDI